MVAPLLYTFKEYIQWTEEAENSGVEFPLNLDDWSPLVASTRGTIKQALISNVAKNQHFNTAAKNKTGHGRQAEIITVTFSVFEDMMPFFKSISDLE